MSHDCIPNTNHTDEENNYRLTVRASTKISVGHPITLSYAYTLQVNIPSFENYLFTLVTVVILIFFPEYH